MDNAPVHTAKESKKYLARHRIWTIEWLPYSPDLNLSKYKWWALKRKLHELFPKLDYIGESADE